MWGIKLENKYLVRSYLRDIILFTLFYILILVCLDQAFNGVLVDYLARSSYGLAQFVMDFKYILALVFYIFGILAISGNSIRKAQKYMNQMIQAAKKVTNENAEINGFPTEMKDVEMMMREIQRTIAQKEQEAKEAEQRKNDLVVYLAHDLKTPLTSVIGYLSLLEESPDIPIEQRAKYTRITLDKAYRLEQLINEFFDITRFNLQTLVMERNHIHISLMLEQMADEFYPVLKEKNISLETEIVPDMDIIGDVDKLARVFDNLIRNAVNYCNENGSIHLSAKIQEENLVVTVSNTGDEIPPEKLDRLFERFYRVDASRTSQNGGAGLGLAIAKELVELHKGTIAAISNETYTRFTVMLPKS